MVLGPRYCHRDCAIRNSGPCSCSSGLDFGLLLFRGGLWPSGRRGSIPAAAPELASEGWTVRPPAVALPAGLWAPGCRTLDPASALESAPEDWPPRLPAVAPPALDCCRGAEGRTLGDASPCRLGSPACYLRRQRPALHRRPPRGCAESRGPDALDGLLAPGRRRSALTPVEPPGPGLRKAPAPRAAGPPGKGHRRRSPPSTGSLRPPHQGPPLCRCRSSSSRSDRCTSRRRGRTHVEGPDGGAGNPPQGLPPRSACVAPPAFGAARGGHGD